MVINQPDIRMVVLAHEKHILQGSYQTTFHKGNSDFFNKTDLENSKISITISDPQKTMTGNMAQKFIGKTVENPFEDGVKVVRVLIAKKLIQQQLRLIRMETDPSLVELLRNYIIDISVSNNLLCPFTAFVAIEHENKKKSSKTPIFIGISKRVDFDRNIDEMELNSYKKSCTSTIKNGEEKKSKNKIPLGPFSVKKMTRNVRKKLTVLKNHLSKGGSNSDYNREISGATTYAKQMSNEKAKQEGKHLDMPFNLPTAIHDAGLDYQYLVPVGDFSFFELTDETKRLARFTMEEVSKHNKKDDCWIVIKDVVMDVTHFKQHPGSFEMLLQFGGKDCTEMARKMHSLMPEVIHLFNKYVIGLVEENGQKISEKHVENSKTTNGFWEDYGNMVVLGAFAAYMIFLNGNKQAIIL